jgi:hypothetical protein
MPAARPRQRSSHPRAAGVMPASATIHRGRDEGRVPDRCCAVTRATTASGCTDGPRERLWPEPPPPTPRTRRAATTGRPAGRTPAGPDRRSSRAPCFRRAGSVSTQSNAGVSRPIFNMPAAANTSRTLDGPEVLASAAAQLHRCADDAHRSCTATYPSCRAPLWAPLALVPQRPGPGSCGGSSCWSGRHR